MGENLSTEMKEKHDMHMGSDENIIPTKIVDVSEATDDSIWIKNYIIEEDLYNTVYASCKIPKNKMTLVIGTKTQYDSIIKLLLAIGGYYREKVVTQGDILIKDEKGNYTTRNPEKWLKKVNCTLIEDPKLYNTFTVKEIITHIAELKGKKKKVANILSLLDLEKCKNQCMHSFNQYQEKMLKKVMLAIGLLLQNEINIWEVFDMENLDQVIDLIQKNNETNIITTEYPVPNLLIDKVDWIVFMHGSTVVYSGTRDHLLSYFRMSGVLRTKDCSLHTFFSTEPTERYKTNSATMSIKNLYKLANARIKAFPVESKKKMSNVWFVKMGKPNLWIVKQLMARAMRTYGPIFGFWIYIEIMMCVIALTCIVGIMYFFGAYDGRALGIANVVDNGSFEMIIDLLQTVNQISNFSGIKQYVNQIIRFPYTIHGLNLFAQSITMYRFLYTLAAAFLVKYSLKSSYVEACLFDIKMGLYSPWNLIITIMIEFFIRNTVIHFIFQIITYFIVNRSILQNLAPKNLINYSTTDYLIAAFCSNFVFGLYIQIFGLLSHSNAVLNRHVFFGTTVSYLSIGIEKIMVARNNNRNSYQMFQSSTRTFTIPLFDRTYSEIKRQTNMPPVVSRCPVLSRSFWHIDSGTASCDYPLYKFIVSNIYKYIYKCGVPAVFDEIFYKCSVYRGYFNSPGPIPDYSALYDAIQTTDNPEIAKSALQRIYMILTYLPPHEIMNENTPIGNITMADILLTSAKYTILPTILLLLTLQLMYRKLQPGIRK
ncbi:hypothetical protein NEPAR05_0254 [Nematocida parisii]|nr:hypothetical protein NEPAR05_0254 [Nematocida parisii]